MAQKHTFGGKMKYIGIKGIIVALGLAVLQLFPSCFGIIDARNKIADSNAILEVAYSGTVLRSMTSTFPRTGPTRKPHI